MMTAIRRFFPDLLMLLLVAGVSGWSGWEAVRIYGEELSLSSQSHLFGLRPSALFAAGLGLGHTDCEEQEFPELDAFMERKLAAIPRSAYPEACEKPFGRNFHFYFHYYVIAFMGGMFRLFGISVQTIHLACVVMHVAAMMFLYLLLRLMMGRLLSLFGTVYVATLPAFLVVLPDFRDYGKVPFFLAALLLMGYLLKKARAPWRQIFLALALGIVIGVGYGFRQDLLICMPPAMVLLLFGVRMHAFHRWRWRVAAAVACAAAFMVAAAPVFRGRQESGDFIIAHTLLQGLTSSAEAEIQFGNADYDFGFLGLDTPVIASVGAYALRTGREYPESYVSPQYADAGGSLFRETVLTFPADFAARALAATEHTFHIPGSRFIRETLKLAPYSGGGHRLELFDKIHAPLDEFFSRYGPLCAVLAVAALAAQSYRAAFWVSVLFFYFAAYPSLLAEFRHLFYLAFVPFFFTGSLCSRVWQSAYGACRRRQEIAVGPWLAAGARNLLKGFLFVAALAGLIAAALAGLRFYQYRQAGRLLDRYAGVQLRPLPCRTERHENRVRLVPEQSLSEFLNVPFPSRGQLLPAYLAVRFKQADRTVAFTLLNENDAFVKPCQLRLKGTGSYFFPAYEFGGLTNTVFTGLELSAEDGPLVEGLYLVENGDTLPLWPFIGVPENRAHFLACKTGSLDRWAETLGAELVSRCGLRPERGVDAYAALIRRTPGHLPFAERALAHAARSGDETLLPAAWETIGVYMPEMRSEAALRIAEIAGALENEGSYEQAIQYYEAALNVSPGELWNRVRIGEIQAASGDQESALHAFKSILRQAPESPHTAKLLDDLCQQEGLQEDAAAFWRELGEAHPDAAVPLLFLGMSLERAGDTDAAYDAYSRFLRMRPDHAPALYRQGALEAVRGNIEGGAGKMRDAAKRDPQLASEIAKRCAEVAVYFSEQKHYETAVYLNRSALEIFPDDLWPQVRLGELYEVTGDLEAARNAYLLVLEKAPESPQTAGKLEALMRRMDLNARQCADVWEALVNRHPDAKVPATYLQNAAVPLLFHGMSMERAGDMDAAYEAYTRSLKSRPDHAPALYRLGALEAMRGNVEGGADKMRDAAKRDPQLAGEIAQRCAEAAAYFGEQKRYEAAIYLNQTALEIFPDDLWPQVRLGELYEVTGDLEAARNAYLLVLEKAPESPHTAGKLEALMRRMKLDARQRREVWGNLVNRHPDAKVLVPYLQQSEAENE